MSNMIRGTVVAASLLVCLPAARADSGPYFIDVSAQPGVGLTSYQRVGSQTVALVDALYQQSLVSPITLFDIAAAPQMPRGLPGAALLDYDRDGDLDIYVTNGAGAANSLFQSQLAQTGALGFIDVAASAGVAATSQDSFGTCFGDIDNDGDHDLLVLGRAEPNRLFENQGDGSFIELTGAGVGGGTLTSTSCSMGDIDNDGLLDIVVANAFDMIESFAIFVEPYAFNEPNLLFLNQGDNTFADVSDSSGIRVNGGYPAGEAGITWATTIADVNRDGNADIIFMDDQGAILPARVGGIDRGYIHVFLGDGAGQFVDHPIILDDLSASEWMGVDVADLDCDGKLDLFASSFGDYDNPIFGVPYIQGGSASRPFFGNGDGSFRDGVFEFGPQATPFGWGSAIVDYDNDGDNDIIYHGGLDAGNRFTLADNPGVILENQACSGVFTPDTSAITTDHIRRNNRGVAVGDVDRDGFIDVVTVANLKIPDNVELLQAPILYGEPFDSTALYSEVLEPINNDPSFPLLVWNGIVNELGDLKLELSTGNHNRSVRVRALGAVGLTPAASVNRDGIGAQLSFTPKRGHTAIQVITGGASHSSQHALERVFGLGQARKGTLEVLWPGGTRNRLYNLKAGTDVLMPEIPCSFDADWSSPHAYKQCVKGALADLIDAGAISHRQRGRLLSSAIRAYHDHRSH